MSKEATARAVEGSPWVENRARGLRLLAQSAVGDGARVWEPPQGRPERPLTENRFGRFDCLRNRLLEADEPRPATSRNRSRLAFRHDHHPPSHHPFPEAFPGPGRA